MSDALLASLIDFSRDGEWGKGEPDVGLTEARVVRGTDFDAFRRGDLGGLPTRFIQEHKVQMKRLRPGDIIIETAGGTQDRPTGRTVFVRDELVASAPEPLVCASFARVIRVDPAKIDPAFLSLWLDHAWKTRALQRWNVQHTGVARFHWTKCAETLHIPLPDRPNQALIAAPLLAIDRWIANNRRRVEVLEEMARAIYREWFVKFRYPGHEDVPLVDSALGPIPERWGVKPLARIANVNGLSRKPTADEVFRYLDITALAERQIGELDAISGSEAPGRARRMLHPGDTVWATVRPNRRAHALVVAPGDDWIASTGLAVLTPTAVSPAFLFETTSTTAFSDWLVGRATGSAYPAVRANDFEEAMVVVPDSRVDAVFAEKVAPIHELSWKLRAECSALAGLRDLLLPKLVTGQIDVSTLDLDALVEDRVA